MTRAGIAFLLLFGMASCVAFVSHQHSIHIARSRSTCGGLARTAILCAMDLRQKNLRRRSTGKSFERPSLIQLRQYGITRERCNTSIPTQSMHTIAGKPSTLEQGSSYATLSNENTQSLLRNNVNVSISIIGDAFVDLLCFLNNGQNNTGISGDTHLPVEVGGDTLLERPIVPMPGGSGINTATHLRYILDEYGQSEVRNLWNHGG